MNPSLSSATHYSSDCCGDCGYSSVVQRQENRQNIQFWLFSEFYLVIYSFNLSNIIFNIDGSLWCWQDLLVAGVHFHSNIFPFNSFLPGILRAASRSRPSAARSGPPLRVQVIIQQEWSRTVACKEHCHSQSPHFANIMCRNVSQYCEQGKCIHQSPIIVFFLLSPPIYSDQEEWINIIINIRQIRKLFKNVHSYNNGSVFHFTSPRRGKLEIRCLWHLMSFL